MSIRKKKDKFKEIYQSLRSNSTLPDDISVKEFYQFLTILMMDNKGEVTT